MRACGGKQQEESWVSCSKQVVGVGGCGGGGGGAFFAPCPQVVMCELIGSARCGRPTAEAKLGFAKKDSAYGCGGGASLIITIAQAGSDKKKKHASY